MPSNAFMPDRQLGCLKNGYFTQSDYEDKETNPGTETYSQGTLYSLQPLCETRISFETAFFL